MSSWADGYASESLYVYHYFDFFSPNYIKTTLSLAGFKCPDLTSGNGFELGYGQGLNLIFNHLCGGMKWYGNDFNPSQTRYAQGLAKEFQINDIYLSDESFAQLNDNPNLPKFKYIALHGIWSWISKENQEHILKFIDEHLEENGVLYISYNCTPRFLVLEPIRQIFLEFLEERVAKISSLEEKMQALREFFKEIQTAHPQYFDAVKDAELLMDNMIQKSPHYFSGEFFNQSWHILHFSELNKRLNNLGLHYATAADAKGSNADYVLPQKRQDFLQGFSEDVDLVQSIIDVWWYNMFRKDVFVRCPKEQVKLSASEHAQELEKLSFVINPIYTSSGFTKLQEPNSNFVHAERFVSLVEAFPYLETFFSDCKIHSFSEIRELVNNLTNEEKCPTLCTAKEQLGLDRLTAMLCLCLMENQLSIISIDKHEVSAEQAERIWEVNKRMSDTKDSFIDKFGANYVFSSKAGAMQCCHIDIFLLKLALACPDMKESEVKHLLTDSILSSYKEDEVPKLMIAANTEYTTREEYTQALEKRVEDFFRIDKALWQSLGMIR